MEEVEEVVVVEEVEEVVVVEEVEEEVVVEVEEDADAEEHAHHEHTHEQKGREGTSGRHSNTPGVSSSDRPCLIAESTCCAALAASRSGRSSAGWAAAGLGVSAATMREG